MATPDDTASRRGLLAGLVTTLVLVAAVAALIATFGGGPGEPAQATGGDPELGRAALVEYGCAACHRIPELRHPPSDVGPSLHGWADRDIIAGRLPNTAEDLVAWIVSPQAIDPGNAMPDLGVPEPDARDMAAYLFTLRGAGR
jgi:cytochrome c